MNWVIRTADEEWAIEAETPDEALYKAWQEKPPNNVGFVVSIDPEGGDTLYMEGESAVTVAGYSMEEEE